MDIPFGFLVIEFLDIGRVFAKGIHALEVEELSELAGLQGRLEVTWIEALVRIVRGEVMKLKGLEFVEASRAIGVPLRM